MSWHDLNPHVINSLFCLGGIMLCLVLIGRGMISDLRQRAADAETERHESAMRPRPAPTVARRVAAPTPRLSYRQVA
jgi:hypothetical protein